ncbi:MAG: LamG-like jellyroll fold domain-containing protein [Verrucomicrobiota bacterium]
MLYQRSPNEVEEYDHNADSWRILSGLNWTPIGSIKSNWPWVMVAPDGRLFHFGHTETMHWVDAEGNGSLTSTSLNVPGSKDGEEAGFVMYDIGKVLAPGGYISSSNRNATDAAYVVNFNVNPVEVRTLPGGMQQARQFANCVVLPNGEVLILGGNSQGRKFTDIGGMNTVELWNPVTEQFRLVASMSVSRGYHSTALLLPDGRVFCGGSGYGGNGSESWNKDNAEFYTPPILFNSNGTPKARPTLNEAPESVACGSVFEVTGTSGLAEFAAIRLQSTTHAMNTDQRRITLPFSESATGVYRVIAHPNENVMIPGYWMLFGVQANGAYSEAKIIHVTEVGDSPDTGLDGPDPEVTTAVSVDDVHELYIDGELVGIGTEWDKTYLAKLSAAGSTIAIRACNTGGGFHCVGDFTIDGERIVTDSTWKVSTTASSGWNQPGFNDSSWADAQDYGAIPGPVQGMPSGSAARNIWSSNPADDEVFLRYSVNGLRISPVADQSHSEGDPVDLLVTATGGEGSYTWSATGLPSGLDINPGTGRITGNVTPGSAGTTTVTVTVIDGIGAAAQRIFEWIILGEEILNESFESNAGGFVYVDDLFRNTNQPGYASGSRVSSGGVQNSGALQALVGGLDTNVVLNMSGGWQYSFTLSQPKQVNLAFSYNFLQSILYEPDEFGQVLLSVDGNLVGKNGNDYLVQINGGSSSGTGVQSESFDLGILSAGNHTIAIGAYNNKKTWSNEQLTLYIDDVVLTAASLNSPPVLNAIADQENSVGSSVNVTFSATDVDNDPLTYSASNLPPGLTVDADTGVVSGTPTAEGDFSVTATVTDGVVPDSQTFNWFINDALQMTAGSSGVIETGANGTFTANVSGGTGVTYVWNFGDGTGDTSPSSSPSVSHTFASPGRYNVNVTATDASGATVSQTFVQNVHGALPSGRPVASSSIITTGAGASLRVWNVNPDNDSVTVYDPGNALKLAEIAVGEDPKSLAQAGDGKVWVTNKSDATLSLIDPGSLSVQQTISLPTGSHPHGILFSSGHAFVVLEGTGELLKINEASGSIVGTADIGASPRHLALTTDESQLLVSRFITPPVAGEASANPSILTGGGEILPVNPGNLSVGSTIFLAQSTIPDFGGGGRGLPNYLAAAAISPDGTTAWIPSKQDNIHRGDLRDGSPLNHQNTVRAITSRVDLSSGTEEIDGRVDHDDSGIPSAAVYGPYGVYVFVALESSREVAVIDAYGKFELLRVDVGRAPQGLSLSPDGDVLFVHNFMSRSVTPVEIEDLVEFGIAEVTAQADYSTVASEALALEVLLGKQHFYDARDNRLAKEDYMSCASCHNDGGHDGRVWDLTQFGEGIRNTIDLRGRSGMGHGLLHWTANFDEVQDFEGQIRELSGGDGFLTTAEFNQTQDPLGPPKAGLDAGLDALAAYVSSLSEEPDSPFGGAGNAANGESLFVSLNCAQCHGGETFTDNLTHDIGTIVASSGQASGGPLTGIDTPSLRGVWDGAPYLHDGSAATLQAAIDAHAFFSLSSAELDDLAAFVAGIDGSLATAPAPGNTGSGDSVIHLTFEEGTGSVSVDQSGNGHDGELINGVSWNPGRYGIGVSTSGGGDLVRIPHTPEIHLAENDGDFSVNFWVRLEEDHTGDWRGLAGKGVSWNQRGFAIFLRPNDNRMMLSMSTTVSHNESQTSAQELVPGQWTYLSLIKEGSDVRFYLNGALDTTLQLTGASLGTVQDFHLGRGPGGADPAHASFDSLQVFRRALDTSEINQLKDTDDSGGGPGNVAPSMEDQSFVLDEGTGNGTQVGSIVASDPNSGPDGDLTFSVTGGSGQGLFAVAGSTGVITVADSSSISASGSPYLLEVEVTDGGSPSLQDDAVITLNVNPIGGPTYPSGNLALLLFEEGTGTLANDSSGNGNSGTLLGDSGWAAGYEGGGLQTTGNSGSQLEIPHSPGIHLGENDGDFTVAFWMRLDQDATGSWRGLAGKGTSGNSRAFGLFLRPDRNQLLYSVSTVQGPKESGNADGLLSVGVWTHLALVKEGSSVRLYLDGEEDSSKVLSSASIGNLQDFFLGRAPGSAAPTAASFDSLLIYDRALSASEVAQAKAVGQSEINRSPEIEDQFFTVEAGSTSGTNVGSVVASDPDAGPAGDLSFTVTGGSGASALTVDSSSGQILVSDPSQITVANSPLLLNIQVSDGGSPSLQASATATVTVVPADLGLPGDLQAWLPFEEGTGSVAADYSGNGQNGTLDGDASWVLGPNGGAAAASGNPSSWVRLPHSPALHLGANNGDFTVAFHVNLQEDATGGWRGLAGKGVSWNERAFGLYLRPDSNRIEFNISTTVTHSESSTTDIPLTVGQWTAIAYVKEGSQIRLYLDGALSGTRNLNGVSTGNLADIFLGDAPGGAVPTNAIYDSLQVYSRALSFTEIQQVKDAPDPSGGSELLDLLAQGSSPSGMAGESTSASSGGSTASGGSTSVEPGTYSLVIPLPDDVVGIGDGFGTLVLNSDLTGELELTMGDGSLVSQTVQVLGNSIEIAAAGDANADRLSGTAQFEDLEGVSDLAGFLQWEIENEAEPVEVVLIGSRLSGQSLEEALGTDEVRLTLSGDETDQQIGINLQGNQIVGLDAEYDPLTGIIEGSVLEGDQTLTFKGAYLEDQNVISGFYHDGEQRIGQMQITSSQSRLLAILAIHRGRFLF